MNYKEFINLQDIAWFKNGINYKEDSTGEKVRIINVTNLVSNDFIYDHTELSQVQLPFEKFKSYLLKENDLVISRSASPGEPILFKGKKPTIYSGFSILIRLINKDYLPLFILYYLNYYKRNIINVSDGTIFKNLNQQILKEIQIPKIKKTQQGAISKILLDLDNKIELNNKINNNLEELAQALYKHWFVDFEFPNEEGLPYKSSGGKMIKSEKALIPEGWHTIYLDEYLEFERGVEPGSKNYNETQIRESIPFFRVGDLNVYNPTFVSKEHLKEKSVNLDDVLVSFDGAIGRVGIGFEGSYSTGLRKIYPKKDIFFPKEYIYYLFKSDDIQNTLKNYANGTTILHASSSIRFLKTFYNEKIIRDFSKVISPIFSKVIQIINENDKLAETRDLLLPKLMSGEIRVPIKE